MSLFTNFLRSLVLSIIFSFIAPMVLIGGFLLLVSAIAYLPGLQEITDAIATPIMEFLTIFGSGTPLGGLFVICLTFSVVGALFDMYVYYRCQILR
ncbi:hypothetical protein NUACC21_22790 [Scytonema sp. NUACC21]